MYPPTLTRKLDSTCEKWLLDIGERAAPGFICQDEKSKPGELHQDCTAVSLGQFVDLA